MTTALVAGSGLFIGSILYAIAEEEVKSGWRFIDLFARIVLFCIVLFSLFMGHLTILFMSTFAMILFFSRDEFWVYPVLGIIAAVASFKDAFPVLALIFILGFPIGSLAVKRNIWDSLIKRHITLYFLFIFFALFTGYLL